MVDITKNTEAIEGIVNKYLRERVEVNKSAIDILEKYHIDTSEDKWLYELLKNNVEIREDTGGNSIVYKDVAIILTQFYLSNEEIEVVGKELSKLVRGRPLSAFMGHVDRAKKNKIYKIFKNEFNKFVEDNQYPLTKYVLNEEEKKENKTHRLTGLLDSLSNEDTNKTEKINEILDLVSNEDPIYIDNAIGEVKKKTNISIKTLKKQLTERIRESKILMTPTPLKKEITNFRKKREKEELRKEVLTLLASYKSDEATELLCSAIEQEEHICTTREDDKPETWIYRDGIWKPNGKTYIKEFCRDILQQAHTPHLANAVVDKISADTFMDAKEFFKESEVEEIPVLNGLLNIFTKQLSPFTPEKRFFTKIPINFIAGKDCPQIKNFLRQILKHEEDLLIIQEWFGYCLLRDYRIEKAIMLTGSGRNGKGRLLELLKRFLGVDNCVNIQLQDIEKDNFALSELHGKLANISGDLSKEAITNSGNFKMLTGEDTITANRKFKVRISFLNYAKQIYSANDLPKSYDLTDGFFSRWILLEFLYKFLSQKELNLLDERERNILINNRPKYNLADKTVVASISTSEELCGLLNWALEGLTRLLEQRDFSYSKSMDEVRDIWIRKSDSFQSFCMDCLEQQYDSIIPKEELRQKYNDYCREHKIIPVSDRAIKETLSRELGATDSQKVVYTPNENGTPDNRKVSYVWEGIKFKAGAINNS